jgi:hypothetical protein
MLKVLTFDISQIPTIGSTCDTSVGFWGVDIEDSLIINDFMSDGIKSDISTLDIIWIYGYDFNNNKHKSPSDFIEYINSNVKSCSKIIFDLQGEGHRTEYYLMHFDLFRDKIKLKNYKSKILWNLNKPLKYKDYDIFYSKYYELVYWFVARNVSKLKFENNTDRPYFFSFFNGDCRPHRYKMLKYLLNNEELKKSSLISNLDKSSNLPYIAYNYESNSQNKFTSTDDISRLSYVSLVSESHSNDYNGLFFLTEKSIKPFVLQQIPIFIGAPGIASHFRNYGFDLFDDIVNHSYDNEVDLDLRINLILTELNKIYNYNFKNIFEQINDRLYHNYNLYKNMLNHIEDIDKSLKKWILE